MSLSSNTYRKLGNTSLKVSPICFGTLTISPLQRNFSFEEGSHLLSKAYELGINFVDTAEIYDTYSHIRESIKLSGFKPIIATKAYCYDKETAKVSVEKALTEMGVESLDIFLLHEQTSYHSIRGHFEAIEKLLDYKSQGLIKYIGISTHTVEGVKGTINFPELEIIHPIYNIKGIGIVSGSREEMLAAIKTASSMGKGIYAMKALGGGHLLNQKKEALKFCFEEKSFSSLAIGMQSLEEMMYNINIFLEKEDEKISQALENKKREMIIHDWCTSCQKCAKICPQGALNLGDSQMIVNQSKCVFCGYCARVCEEFCIKVI